MTVLATLNTRFKALTMEQLLKEVSDWAKQGRSRFQEELANLATAKPPPLTT
jgi:hypothetical protein